jgi:hypothetical protein
MRLYPTHIILEYIEFSRATPHEVLISPKRERGRKHMRRIPVYLFCSFVKRTNPWKVAPKPHKHTNERTK